VSGGTLQDVVIAGDFEKIGADPYDFIAVYDGHEFTEIGSADDSVICVAADDDYIYAAGDFLNIGGVAANRVARMAKSSGVWEAMGDGFNDRVHWIHVESGVLYAAGTFTASGAVALDYVAVFSAGAWGPIDTVSGDPFSADTNCIAVIGGNVYVGGTVPTFRVFSGGAWGEVDDMSPDDWVYSIAEYDGAIYVGGKYISVTGTGGAVNAACISRIVGGAWEDLGNVTGGGGGVGSTVWAIYGDTLTDHVFLGGEFETASQDDGGGGSVAIDAFHCARYMPVSDTFAPIGSGLNSTVRWIIRGVHLIDPDAGYSSTNLARPLYFAGQFTDYGP
jgi:hypothetical protein